MQPVYSDASSTETPDSSPCSRALGEARPRVAGGACRRPASVLLAAVFAAVAVHAETPAPEASAAAPGGPETAQDAAPGAADTADSPAPRKKKPKAAAETAIAPAVNLSDVTVAPPGEDAQPAAEANTDADSAAPAAPGIDAVGDPATVVLLGSAVKPGIATRLAWSPRVSFTGIESPTPVLVVNGARPGKTLCLTAAIHGDELNGIEIVRRVMYSIDPAELTGTVIGVPIVNLQGFQRASRYLPDRRDLNRFFPGNSEGSLASRIAHSFFTRVIARCDALVDLHTASFHRSNLPQVRADMRNPAVAKFSESFDQMVIVHNEGAEGTLRRATADQGIPAVTLEAGESLRLQEEVVQTGVNNVMTLLDRMGMYDQLFVWGKPQPVYYTSRWVRAEEGGILLRAVRLGARVKRGDLLGSITDPITNYRTEIRSPYAGRVIGMAVNQVVMPGFAAFHIGIQASDDELAEQAGQAEEASVESDPNEEPLSDTAEHAEDLPPE